MAAFLNSRLATIPPIIITAIMPQELLIPTPHQVIQQVAGVVGLTVRAAVPAPAGRRAKAKSTSLFFGFLIIEQHNYLLLATFFYPNFSA